MSKRSKIIRNIALLTGVLLVVAIVATITVSQTDWFQNYVRQKIITSTEESTGGKVELGAFTFDPRQFRVEIADFVIHGKEPQGSAPFVRIRRAQSYIRLFTSVHHLIDIVYLGVDGLETNVIVLPDGSTNMPEPKKKSASNRSPLETVVNLAVGRFDLTNGVLVFDSQKQEVNIHANGVRAELLYNVLEQRYRGKFSFEPLYVASGQNMPVRVRVTLPVVLERDRVEMKQARIDTARSAVLVDGSVENMRSPKVSAHINGHLAIADLKDIGRFAGTIDTGHGLSVIDLDANATIASNLVQVTGLRLGIGSSNLEANGTLRDASGAGALAFKSRLALGELGRLVKVGARPEGTVLLNGTAKLDQHNNYQIRGNIQTTQLSFQQGRERITNVNLYSALALDPHWLELNGLRLSAFGGEFRGNASLQDFEQYRVDGALHNLDLQSLIRSLGQQRLPYEGIVTGPIEAVGNLKGPSAATSLIANARLAIAPGKKRGIPVSGKLNVAYNGASGDLRVTNSQISLPHSRLTLDGSVEKQLNVTMTSTDLDELLAAGSIRDQTLALMNGGQANFAGAITGGVAMPHIAGQVNLNRFSIEGRGFDQLRADVSASSAGAVIRDATLTRGAMQTQLAASVGLRNWKPLPSEPLSANLTIRNGDLADLLALAGRPSSGYSGVLSAGANISGTIGNPQGAANITVANGAIDGEPFDRIQAQVNLADRLVTVSNASLVSGAARANLNASFEHPRDSFTTGCLEVKLDSSQFDLAQLRIVQRRLPNTAGIVQITASVSATLTRVQAGGEPKPQLQLTSIDGEASVRALRSEGQNYGDLNLNARTRGQIAQYNLTSNFAGSNTRVNGSTQLRPGYPTDADATMSNLPIERVLALAHRTDIRAKGNLSGTAHFSGTAESPQGNADINLTNAVLYDQPLDRAHARLSYLPQAIELSELQIAAGSSAIDLNARYDHPAGNVQTGSVRFQVNSSRIDLAKLKFVQEKRPGIAGALQLMARGEADIRNSGPRVLVRDLDGNLKASGLAVQDKALGDLTLTAATDAGRVNFTLDSNLADASIQGRGSAQVSGDYPVDAQVTFKNVTWARVQPLIGAERGGPATFDAAVDGQVSVRGPATKIEELTGSVQVTRLELSRTTRTRKAGDLVFLRNEGPITATLEPQLLRIQAAHVVGPQTDFRATGTIPLRRQAMDLNLNGNVDLAILQNFSQDITSSGNITVATVVRGSVTDPLLNGRVELRNGSINYAPISNGISKANGTIVLSGNTASISNLSAESGGGKITLRGFLTMTGSGRFGLRADASNVRVLLNPSASIVVASTVNVTGTTDSSVISGNVTIDRVTYAPQTDLGSILTRAAPPVQAAAAPSPLLENMKLDLRVRSSDALAVQASLAENLQVDADLRIRGSLARPGVLGRVVITEGKLVFFGSTYTVTTGTIGFYNPVRIEPVLDMNLETEAKGVQVVLRVTGPVDNMKLTYTSDPPLQFQEIVSLLAAGKTPTSDPTLLANQPSQPAQSFQQMGESALLSKALADPLANRLQRVFGVSQLKIDPTFTSGSQLPQANLTLQQRVADNITFTYNTALNNPNALAVEVEVTLTSQWSATAMRDQNGIFSINLLYKRQVR